MLVPVEASKSSSTQPVKGAWSELYRPSITAARIIPLSRITSVSFAASKPLPRKVEKYSEISPMTIADRYLRAVQSLGDDWDGEGAPRPSVGALGNARRVLIAALGQSMSPSFIEADVLGGVAIGFDSTALVGDRPKRSAWIACMNSGSVSVVLRDRATGNKSRGEAFTPGGAGALADFVNGDE